MARSLVVVVAVAFAAAERSIAEYGSFAGVGSEPAVVAADPDPQSLAVDSEMSRTVPPSVVAGVKPTTRPAISESRWWRGQLAVVTQSAGAAAEVVPVSIVQAGSAAVVVHRLPCPNLDHLLALDLAEHPGKCSDWACSF